jgi:hypothetical protein
MIRTRPGLTTFLILFVVWGALNTSGFCFAELRYIPREEFFEKFLESKTLDLKPKVLQIRNWANDQTIQYTIPYKDAKDFMALNPECCDFGPAVGVLAESDRPPTFLQRFLGSAWGLVAVRFRYRYVDGQGQSKDLKFFTQFWADSCGTRIESVDQN